jgi:hypothetical protein
MALSAPALTTSVKEPHWSFTVYGVSYCTGAPRRVMALEVLLDAPTVGPFIMPIPNCGPLGCFCSRFGFLYRGASLD